MSGAIASEGFRTLRGLLSSIESSIEWRWLCVKGCVERRDANEAERLCGHGVGCGNDGCGGGWMAGRRGGYEDEGGRGDTAAGGEVFGDAACADGDCATAGDWNWRGAARQAGVEAP